MDTYNVDPSSFNLGLDTDHWLQFVQQEEQGGPLTASTHSNTTGPTYSDLPSEGFSSTEHWPSGNMDWLECSDQEGPVSGSALSTGL